MATPPRILITHGRSRMSYVAAKSLARAGYEVYICDASPLNMSRAARMVRGFDRTPNPFKLPLSYVERLAEIVTQRKIDLLLPGHEDVFSIQAHADRLPAQVVVAAPPYAELCHVADKLEIVRVAESVGVAAPTTLAIHSMEDLAHGAAQLGFPLMVKARRGSGGKGVHRVDSLAELTRKFTGLVNKYASPPAQWPVLQQYIPDGQLFGTCFLAEKGRLVAVFTERYVRCKESGGGTSVLRERYEWPLLAEATARLVAALQWTGIGHLDFIANAELTEAYLLEMNPRWWGALNLAVANGFDFPLGLVTMVLEGKVAPNAFCALTPPRRSLWIVGELMACRAEMMEGKFAAPATSLRRILWPGADCVYDDFSWGDPLPLAAQFGHYFGRFVRNRLRGKPAAFDSVSADHVPADHVPVDSVRQPD